MSENSTVEKQVDDILSTAMIMDSSKENDPTSIDNTIDNTIEQNNDNLKWIKIDTYIKSVNDDILLNYLAPEVKFNENKKREHKDKLIKYVSIFLISQFTVIFIILFIILCSVIYFHYCKNDLDYQIIKILFGFFGTYITSVIVELIFILKFIVEKVFDTSITSLMEIFKSKDNEEDKKKDNKEDK